MTGIVSEEDRIGGKGAGGTVEGMENGQHNGVHAGYEAKGAVAETGKVVAGEHLHVNGIESNGAVSTGNGASSSSSSSADLAKSVLPNGHAVNARPSTSHLTSSVPASPTISPPSIPPSPNLALSPESTASLIQALYARLDAQGVMGDGYMEGQERSRDGIIGREAAMGGLTLGRDGKGKGKADEFGTDGVLTSQEESILRRVDRYGFFSGSHPAALACQHNRIATLSSAPFLTLPTASTSRLKPFSGRSFPPIPSPPTQKQRRALHRSSTASLKPTLSVSQNALETKRIEKWSSMLVVLSRDSGSNAREWGLGRGLDGWSGSRYKVFQRRCFKGVPDRWRRAVWGLMIEHKGEEERGPSLDSLVQDYWNYLKVPSTQDIQIDLDVPRTISGHVLFHTRYGRGQRALFHVLHAFGLHMEEGGGYCQGMGSVVAGLLCYFEPERAYACMVRLFDQYHLRHIFAPGFPGLIEAFYVQEQLVAYLMPDVNEAFNKHGISTSSYATKWYITLFSNSVPFATQLRLWDGLFLEGIDFLVVTALAIIWSFRDQFTSSTASFESILSSLSSYFIVESDDALLRWIRKFMGTKDLRKRMEGARKDWRMLEEGRKG